jgi:hypothetical protein
MISPVVYNMGRAEKMPEPELTAKAKEAEKCIESKIYMRAEHMKILDEWRDEVVRDAERYHLNSRGEQYYKSLQLTCMDCHSNKSKFCDQCHNYMGVDPFCWECHIEPKETK